MSCSLSVLLATGSRIIEIFRFQYLFLLLYFRVIPVGMSFILNRSTSGSTPNCFHATVLEQEKFWRRNRNPNTLIQIYGAGGSVPEIYSLDCRYCEISEVTSRYPERKYQVLLKWIRNFVVNFLHVHRLAIKSKMSDSSILGKMKLAIIIWRSNKKQKQNKNENSDNRNTT